MITLPDGSHWAKVIKDVPCSIVLIFGKSGLGGTNIPNNHRKMKKLLKLLPILGLAIGSLNCGPPVDEGPDEDPEGTEEAVAEETAVGEEGAE